MIDGMEIPKISAGEVQIPQVGLGLWRIKKEYDLRKAVINALQIGYRHFDTAQIYGNEAFLGEVLHEADVPRKDLFITTKLWGDNMKWDYVIPSFKESLHNLQMDYVDLFLVHHPVTERRRSAWRLMEEIRKSGKAKAIGVSNYTIRHLEELLRECDITPAVNQVEIHVYLQQPELIDYCRQKGIVVQAYSPLAHGYGHKDPLLAKLAQKYKKTSQQIMLRWCVQQGLVVIPKSIHPEYIKQNIEIFDFALENAEIVQLASLNKGVRTGPDPTHIP